MAPHVTGLSKRTRTLVFAMLVCIFVVGTPLLWLYASGYRLTQGETGLASSTRTFMPTGGLYIGVEGDAAVSVDDTVMRGSRFFRNAVYLDGMFAGPHRIVVERDGFTTWVKELSVTSQLVTEAYTFALPATTTLRIITPQMTPAGDMVRTSSTTIDGVLANTYVVIPRGTRAASTLIPNTRFESLRDVFNGIAAETAAPQGSLATMNDEIRAITAADATTSPVVLATKNDIELIARGDEVLARYVGSIAKIPYYFCATQPVIATTTATDAGRDGIGFSAAPKVLRVLDGCDPVITIDRQGQSVVDATWYPDSVDAVIMSRADGIYVTEVDARGGWQNTQALVRGQGLRAQVVNGTIYVYDGTDMYEVVHP